jgi:hypothetical protein
LFDSREGTAALVVFFGRDFSVGEALGENVSRSLDAGRLVGPRGGGGIGEEPHDYGCYSEPEKEGKGYPPPAASMPTPVMGRS